jgi:hypothetical protein
MSNDLELITEIEEDSIWLDEHLNEIKEKNSNKFVAVKDKSIILVSDNLDTLLKVLREKKEDLDRLLIEFIHGDDYNFIL